MSAEVSASRAEGAIRAGGSPTWRRGPRFGYWSVAVTYLALQAFMTVPSPLYGVYARRDHLSPFMITVVYAAYALGVTVSLVFAGHLSDTFGRRPLLLAALGLDIASAVVFMAWPELPGLFLARIICGLAVGVTASTATAYLTELFLAHRPVSELHRAQLLSTATALGGLGVGGLVAGVLAQWVPHPLSTSYAVMTGVFAVCAVIIVLGPETKPRTAPTPRYRPQGLAVPAHSRSEFFAALTGVAAQFAVFGLFVGLAGTFLATTLHRTSLALSGFSVFLVFAAGVACTAATMRLTDRVVVLIAVTGMLAGLIALVVSAWLPAPSLPLFLLGGALIGAGGSALFKSSLATVVAVAPPQRLAETLAAFFLAGYVAISAPVIGLGVALQHVSVRTALLAFASVIAVGVLAAAPGLARSRSAVGDSQGLAARKVT